MKKLMLLPLFLAYCGAAFGQSTESEMKNFPMPPSSIARNKTFGYVGDYGYFISPSKALYDTNLPAAKGYKYVRYKGIAGKKVYFWPAWLSPIPAAADGKDACGHTHLSWGAWVKKTIFPVFGSSSSYRWTFVGGGSMSGVRENGQCKHRAVNPISYIDSGRFGWGKEYAEFDYRGNPFVTEIIFGVRANTHGWGTCVVPSGKFPACREPAYINAWTLAQ